MSDFKGYVLKIDGREYGLSSAIKFIERLQGIAKKRDDKVKQLEKQLKCAKDAMKIIAEYECAGMGAEYCQEALEQIKKIGRGE